MPAMTPRHSRYRPDTPKARMRIYDGMRRWVAATDPRIVQRFWPTQRDGSKRPWCPICGVTKQPGMPSQTAIHLPPGQAREVLAAGGLEALTAEMPIEPGEPWYIVCLSCLEDRPRTRSDRWLPERLQALVAEALRDDPR